MIEADARRLLDSRSLPITAERMISKRTVLGLLGASHFVSFAFSRDAEAEIDAFFRKRGRIIIPLTVKDISNESIARKLT